MRRRFIFLCLAFLGLCLPRVGQAQAPASYRAVALSGSGVINNHGQIAGFGLSGELNENGTPIIHAMLWDDVNTPHDLGTLPGGVYSQSTALNDLGQVVGWSETGRFFPLSSFRVRHAFFWDPREGMLDLGALGGVPDSTSWSTAVNDLGQVVGMSTFMDQGASVTHAFIWNRARGIRDIGTESVPLSINNRGEVLFDRAIWSEATGFRSLEAITGGSRPPGVLDIGVTTGPHGLNDNGQFPALGVVGLQPNGDGQPSNINIALRWDPGRGWRNIDPNGASTATAAFAINHSGQVLGVTGAPPRYFLYDDTLGLRYVETLISQPGWSAQYAFDLNDSGEIIASGFRPTLLGRVFTPLLLVPSDRPLPVRILELHLSGAVKGGQPLQGVVLLGQPAPPGGAAVQLSLTGDQAAASVPASVTVPAGETQATFVIQTHPVPVPEEIGAISLILNATYGGTTQRGVVGVLGVDTVEPPDPEPLDLDLDAPTVIGGGSVDVTLLLTAAAPQGGAMVALKSSNAAAIVPAQVRVPAGAASVKFRVTTRAVQSRQQSVLSATRGSTQSVTLEITPPATDTVAVQQATYTAKKRRLIVMATSTQPRATLRAYDAGNRLIGTLKRQSGGRFRGQFTQRADPLQVTVRSSLGGAATAFTTSP